MRKKLAVALAAVLTLQSFAIPAFADENYIIEEEIVGVEETIDSEDEEIVVEDVVDEEIVEEEIVGEEEVDEVVEEEIVGVEEEVIADEEIVGDEELVGEEVEEDGWEIVGDEDTDAVFTYINTAGETVTTKDIGDAVKYVAENGTIYGTGKITATSAYDNNPPTTYGVSVTYGFTLDLSGATSIASDFVFEAANEHCMVPMKDGQVVAATEANVFVYYPKHLNVSASGAAISTTRPAGGLYTGTASVVFSCEHGETYQHPSVVDGTRYIIGYKKTTGEETYYDPTTDYDTFVISIPASATKIYDFQNGMTRMRSDAKVANAETGFNDYVYWWVDAEGSEHTYALDTSDTYAAHATTGLYTRTTVAPDTGADTGIYYDITFTKDRDGVAEQDADKNVKFYAAYTDNTEIQYDDEGNKKRIEATGKFRRMVQSADTTQVGLGLYEVQFTFEDGTKSPTLYIGIDTNGNAQTVAKNQVIVEKKLDAYADSVISAAFLFKNEEDAELWGIPYQDNGNMYLFAYGKGTGNSLQQLNLQISVNANGIPVVDVKAGGSSTTDEKAKYIYTLVFDKGVVTYQPVYAFVGSKSGVTIAIAAGDKVNDAFETNVARNISDLSKITSADAKTFTLASDPTIKNPCGATDYTYNVSSNPITLKYTNIKGTFNVATSKYVPVARVPVAGNMTVNFGGTHTFDTLENWVVSYDGLQVATHQQYGYAIVECQCGSYNNGWTISTNLNDLLAEKMPDYNNAAGRVTATNYMKVLVIPKAGNHKLVQENGTAKVYHYDANCVHGAFDYNVCTVNDGGWTNNASATSTQTYVLSLNKAKTQSASFTAKLGTLNVVTQKYPVTIYNELGDKVDTAEAEQDVVSGNYLVAWHPILVEGTLGPKGDHVYFVRNVNDPDNTLWSWIDETTGNPITAANATKTTNVSFRIDGECTLCTNKIRYIYTNKPATATDELDEGSTDTFTTTSTVTPAGGGATYTRTDITKYNHITLTCADGADCTRGSTLTWTVFKNDTEELKDTNGRTAKSEVQSAKYYGPHTYRNTVTFADDGSASVVQYCTKCAGGSHVDFAGNRGTQTKKATVTAVDNADGSTTYTATLEGYELTNNTITQFDLSKATLIINGGEDLDLGTLDEPYTVSQLITKKLVDLKIGDAAIDLDKVTLTVKNAAVANTLFVGNNEVVVSGNATGYVKSTSVILNCFKKGTLGISDARIDGISYRSSSFEDEFEYDGTYHTVDATVMNGGDHSAVPGATIKYAVIYWDVDDLPNGFDFDSNNYWPVPNRNRGAWRYADTDAKVAFKNNAIDEDKFVYNFDAVSVKDSGLYRVLAKITADGFTDATLVPVVDFIIEKYDTDDAEITTKTRTWTYGDTGFTASTGNAELDTLMGLTTADISTYGVGTYALDKLVTFDNRNFDAEYEEYTNTQGNTEIVSVTIQKRNATVEVQGAAVAYTGEEYTPEVRITGIANNDTLNVEVNVEGGLKLIEPGTYKVTATANNANYNITIIPATITITPNVEDAAAAQKAIEAIDKAAKDPTPANIEAAKKEYNKLTDTQKAIVGEEQVKKLADAEATCEKNKQEAVTSAQTAAKKAANNPTAANIEAAQKAIDAAKKTGATTDDLKAAKDSMVTAANKAAEAAVKNPTEANVKAAQAAIAAAKAAGATTAETKKASDQTKKAEEASKKKVKATLKVSATSVKKGKKTVIKFTSNAGTKITIVPKSKKAKTAKTKKWIKVKNGKTAKVTFKKKAKTGAYKFTVKITGNDKFQATTKVVKIKVVK
jgi:hypothetical protein